jgi:hypothetical protein
MRHALDCPGLFSGLRSFRSVSTALRCRFVPAWSSRDISGQIRMLTALVLCLIGSGLIQAQSLPDTAQGLQPYSAYQGGQLDHVSLQNGGLNVRIPLISFPQKGALSLSYSILLNSIAFQEKETVIACIPGNPCPLHALPSTVVTRVLTGLPAHQELGAQLILDQSLMAGGMTAPVIDPSGNPPTRIGGRYYIVGADGVEHAVGRAADGFRSTDDAGYLFLPSDTSAYPATLSPWATDSPAKMAFASGIIIDSQGVRYSGSSNTDLDGNTILFGDRTTDSTGRTIPSGISTSALSACPSLDGAIDQPLESASTWLVPGANGDQTYIFCYAAVSISTNFFGYGTTHQYKDTFSALQSVILPNGQHWGFIYDSSGQIIFMASGN